MRKYIINDQFYDPIRMGEAGDFDEDCEPTCTCHDCQAKPHEQHKYGCDAERCPCCSGQLISCGCDIKVFEFEDKYKNDFKERKKQYDEEM